MRTANPVLSEGMWNRHLDDALPRAHRMTVGGTINRSLVLLGILVVPAIYSWNVFMRGGLEAVMPYFIGGLLGGLVLGLVTTFVAKWAALTAPLYAVCEGFFLGGLSGIAESRFKGIVFQAVVLTFCIFFAMLVLYTSRTIRATDKFRAGVIVATLGIGLVYLVSLGLRFFVGVRFPSSTKEGRSGSASASSSS